MIDGVYVQYGSGPSAIDGWINYDSSPTLRVQKIPILGKILVPNIMQFSSKIRYGDIVKGLPLSQDSVNGVYASHVIEHLCYSDALIALNNTYKILKSGGLFRIVVPNLVERARRYVSAVDAADISAAEDFLKQTYLGRTNRPRSIFSHARELWGNSNHLWMWDHLSLRHALESTGFSNIKVAVCGNCLDPNFKLVENIDRFVDPVTGITEVAFEAQK